jgi:two-component system, NtrC family, response regulator AtoC
MNHRVLLVDDDASMCELLQARLSKRGFAPEYRTSGEAALQALAESDFEVVVTDISMPGLSGIELCERIVANHPNVPVVVVTAFGSLDTAIAAIRAGAYDFINKPFEIEEMVFALQRAVQNRSLREEVKRLRLVVSESRHLGQLIGASTGMKKVFDLIHRVAGTDASVLITGESGTGKELAARAVHEQSLRRAGPFVALSCAAMPEHLLESELFGHKRGAFTDAHASRDGLFVLADGGTLFLDEIGDMPLTLQPKLLRALEERSVRPVGGTSEVPIDIRVVAATNRDLEFAIEEGRFREDLFFRLNVVLLELPPLRTRGSDVLLIAQHFVELFAGRMDKRVLGLSAGAAEQLLAYAWPGNVRELRNCIERAVALAQYDHVMSEDLPEKIRTYKASHIVVAGTDPSDLVTMDEVERRYVMKVLEVAGGNRTQAAQILGFDRKTLYRKLRRYGVEDEDKKPD